MAQHLFFLALTVPLPTKRSSLRRDFAPARDLIRETFRAFLDDPDAEPVTTRRLWEHTTLLGDGLSQLKDLRRAQTTCPNAFQGHALTIAEPPQHYWPVTLLLPVSVESDRSIPPLSNIASQRAGTVLPTHAAEIMSDAIDADVRQVRLMTLPELLAFPMYESPNYDAYAQLLSDYVLGNPGIYSPQPGHTFSTDGERIYTCLHTLTTWERMVGPNQIRAYTHWRHELTRLHTMLQPMYQIPLIFLRGTTQAVEAMKPGHDPNPFLLTEQVIQESRPSSVQMRDASRARITTHRFGQDITIFYRLHLQSPTGSWNWVRTIYVLDPRGEGAALRAIRAEIAPLGIPIDMDFRDA